jgi:transcriptional regulator with XRE-family HTH domain
MEDVRQILARNVRLARQARGLSQEDLGHEADVDRTYVSGIERGVRNPTITIVARFAGALGTTAGRLLTSGGFKSPRKSPSRTKV